MSLVLLSGCGGDDAPVAGAPAAPSTPSANYATGKVTFVDGSQITGDVKDITVTIDGISEAGERVSYSPAVTNGTYKQKLVPGQYRFSTSSIKVHFGENDFNLNLEPVGSNWNKNRDAADGIVQDWVWKPTGQAQTWGAKPDPNNATHWYGMNLGMRYSTYREDIKASAQPLPEGTKMVFTLTPLSKSIDGKDLKPITIEREWRAKDITPNDDLNDFPPANYEITGVCKLPDGTTKAIVFQGAGDYPNYVEKGRVPLQMDNILSGYFKQLMSWGVN
jgi:hypothetical protein